MHPKLKERIFANLDKWLQILIEQKPKGFCTKDKDGVCHMERKEVFACKHCGLISE